MRPLRLNVRIPEAPRSDRVAVRVALIATLVAGGAVLGCQSPPPPVPVAQPEPAPSLEQLLEAADYRLTSREYARAVDAYERVIAVAPDHLKARYGVAVALSYLDRKSEAAVAFRWVAERGPRESEEVRLARQWLAQTDAALPSLPTAPTVRVGAPDATIAGGELYGRAEWKDAGAPGAHGTLQILLDGADANTRGKRFGTRSRLNEPYRIANVVPGEYRLIAQVGMTRLWDQKVVVQHGASTKLDLTEETTIAKPDALRVPGGPKTAGS